MTDDELIDYCRASIEKLDYILFEEDVYNSLSREQGEMLAIYFASDTLMYLPNYEVKFYEWLRKNDPAIWADLWDEKSDKPYLVGCSYLPRLIGNEGRGFPICDLENNDNFYFAPAHMTDEESKVLIETARTRFQNKESLSTAQLLALEISVDPIDIWHFAYKHQLTIDEAKAAAYNLIEDRALVHLTDAAHVAMFIDW